MAKRRFSEALSEAARRISRNRSKSASKLDLSSFGLPELPESLWELKHLRELDLSGNHLSQVPEALEELAQLVKLSLRDNQLASIPASLCNLRQLRQLDLSVNQLASLPKVIGQIDQLCLLDLSGNRLVSVQETVGQLVQLRALSASNNSISYVPDSLERLGQLQKLDLHDNQISSVPGGLGNLSLLRELDFQNNRLSFIPESFGQLIGLRLLDVSGNQLSSLPRSLASLPKLKQFYLHGNAGLGIPAEVLGPSRESVQLRGSTPADPSGVLRYYFQARAAKRPLNEVKLILVGRGGAGKTSIVNRLVHNVFVPESAKTQGIQITQWSLPVARKTVRVHAWDFGGQEIMHATHQFFLTERSLYIVVLSGREGSEDEDAEYWLKMAASFGGGSPVIIVLNKMKEHRFDVNRRALEQSIRTSGRSSQRIARTVSGSASLERPSVLHFRSRKNGASISPPLGSISRSDCRGCPRVFSRSNSSSRSVRTSGSPIPRRRPHSRVICTTSASP